MVIGALQSKNARIAMPSARLLNQLKKPLRGISEGQFSIYVWHIE